MVEAAPFALQVYAWTMFLISGLSGLLAIGAALHCAVQKNEVFGAIGTISKGTWLAVLLIPAVLAMFPTGLAFIFGLIALCAALVYLLDIRKGIKEIGQNPY
ncbi:DUF2516 family protein [Natronoglycomyces albus]|uniref:DUF2516 family protein n=1 Tax=Natronoglycomyces albus TaxID=2811108 RepID=A0A895XQK3_9ACTN|nr:DUF2516 family protein [Natronoglycomyces albus]QSB05813.1 DUF2516 family protein [Natronoglycomyces albus]